MTVYTLLRNADGLITDYSSVYFDYMLLNRPIGFAVEDMENIRTKEGLFLTTLRNICRGLKLGTFQI